MKTNAMRILVSAGVRGTQVILAPDDLIRITDALVCDISTL